MIIRTVLSLFAYLNIFCHYARTGMMLSMFYNINNFVINQLFALTVALYKYKHDVAIDCSMLSVLYNYVISCIRL